MTLTLKALRETHIKSMPTASYKEVPAEDRIKVVAGQSVRVADLLSYERSHLKLLGSDGKIWWAYARDVEVVDAKPTKAVSFSPTLPPASYIITGVKSIYRSQRDNAVAWWKSCNATSYAMLMLRNGTEEKEGIQLEDEFYRWIVAQGLNPESHPDLAWAAEKFSELDGNPLRCRFVPNATRKQIIKHLAADKPLIMAGYFTSSGHIIAVVGYDENGLICMDPWGNCLAPNEYDKGLNAGNLCHYSWDLLDRVMCRDGDCFAHFVEAV